MDLHHNVRDAAQVFPGPLITDKDVTALCARRAEQVIVVNNTSPEGYGYFPGAVNIGAFYWETEAIPYRLDWPEMIAAMDFSWAKSSCQQDFFRRCGITPAPPVITWPFSFEEARVCGPGRLDRLALTYIERLEGTVSPGRTTAAKIGEYGAPLLLSVSSMAPRKGLPILLSEWRDHVALGGRGVLILKLRPIHNHRLHGDKAPDMAELLAEAGFQIGDKVRIAYTFEDLETEDLRSLYRLTDGYVTATYGEGFGGPVVEALILDRPVIAPRHSSLADLLPGGYPLEIECERLHVGLAGNSPIYPHASSWGLPLRGALVRALQAFEGMEADERRQVMEHARRHAEAFCSEAVVAASLQRFFDGLEPS